MNLQEIMNQITTLGNQIRQANAKIAAMAGDQTVALDDIRAEQAKVQASARCGPTKAYPENMWSAPSAAATPLKTASGARST